MSTPYVVTVPLKDVLEILKDIKNLAEANEAAWQLRSGDPARMAQQGFARVCTACEDAALDLINPEKEPS